MNVLLIDACPRQHSRTRLLAEYAADRIGGSRETLRLCEETISWLSGEALARRDRLIAQGAFDGEEFRLARQFAAADVILIAAPYWDLSFPAVLKGYIEQIMVNGVVFRYTEAGQPQSLCRAKELIYVATSGGPVPGENAGYSYIKLLGRHFWGIETFRLFEAQGLDVDGADVEGILEQAKARMDQELPAQEL